MSPGPIAHPDWLAPLAALLAIAAAALAFGALRARQRARRLLGEDAAFGLRDVLRDLALFAALGAIAVALLSPRIGERTLRVSRSGVDVAILLDVSLSMDAQDVPPSRLDRARRAAREILLALEPGDRAAMAAFAGIGVLLTPLTPDKVALAEMLPALDSELMRPRGSHLGDGVRAALAAFDPQSDRPRVLVVLSDGEDPERRAGTPGAAQARGAGVRVVAAAFGAERGAAVPDHGVPHRDPAGRIVVSRRDVRRLERLARATDGSLLRADAWGVIDLADALAAIRRDAGGTRGEPSARRVPAARARPFAALAFALLVLELGPFALRRRSGRGQRLRRVAASAGIALGLLGAAPVEPSLEVLAWETEARRVPNDAGVLLQLGHARAVDGLLHEAAAAFQVAALTARDPALVALAYYDLGVVELARGELLAARDAFFDALALEPHDAEARYNLEWALRELMRAPTSAAPRVRDRDRPSEGRGSAAARASAASPDPDRDGPGPPETARWEELELSPAEAQRWLSKLEDDPSRALRATARDAAERAPARVLGAPTW